MKVYCYSIYDIKSGVYSNPFYAPTHGAAIRTVQDAANDMNTSLARHPADFILYCVGSFETSDGILQHLEHREHVIDIAALVHQHKPTMPLFDVRTDQPGEYKANTSKETV